MRYNVYVPYEKGDFDSNRRKVNQIEIWFNDNFGREYSFSNKEDAIMVKLVCGGNINVYDIV